MSNIHPKYKELSTDVTSNRLYRLVLTQFLTYKLLGGCV